MYKLQTLIGSEPDILDAGRSSARIPDYNQVVH